MQCQLAEIVWAFGFHTQNLPFPTAARQLSDTQLSDNCQTTIRKHCTFSPCALWHAATALVLALSDNYLLFQHCGMRLCSADCSNYWVCGLRLKVFWSDSWQTAGRQLFDCCLTIFAPFICLPGLFTGAMHRGPEQLLCFLFRYIIWNFHAVKCTEQPPCWLIRFAYGFAHIFCLAAVGDQSVKSPVCRAASEPSGQPVTLLFCQVGSGSNTAQCAIGIAFLG